MALSKQQVFFKEDVKAAARKVAANIAANAAAKRKAELQHRAGRGERLKAADLKFAYEPALDARGNVRTR